MTDLKKILDERMKNMAFMVEISTQKIMKKEMNKLRKDILKGMFQSG